MLSPLIILFSFFFLLSLSISLGCLSPLSDCLSSAFLSLLLALLSPQPPALAAKFPTYASIKLYLMLLAAVSPSRSLWSRSPLSCYPDRLGLSDLVLHHLTHCRSLFFLLRWLWRCFLGWLLWVVFGGFMFLDGCSGLCLVNLSRGWLIWVVVGWFWVVVGLQ